MGGHIYHVYLSLGRTETYDNVRDPMNMSERLFLTRPAIKFVKHLRRILRRAPEDPLIRIHRVPG